MRGCDIAKALREGRRVYGTSILSPLPVWCRAVKGLGVDLVFIDTEHTPVDRMMVSWMCQAYRALDIAPVVRIPRPDPYLATMVLDGGASGIIAPYIESPEEVRRLMGAVKFRPLKGKRLGELLEGRLELNPATAEYLKKRNADNLLILNIESIPAIEALDEILSVPGLDAVLIGPNDLSISLGIPNEFRHRQFNEAVRTIIRKARQKCIGAGIHYWAGIDQEIQWAKEGANLIMHSSDLIAFPEKIKEGIERIKEALGDER